MHEDSKVVSVVGGKDTEEEKKQFGKLWQERVEKILLGTENWDKMITITKG